MTRFSRLTLVFVLSASSVFAGDSRIRVRPLPHDVDSPSTAQAAANASPSPIAVSEAMDRLRTAVLRSAPASARHRVPQRAAAPVSALATRPDVEISWRGDGTPRQIRAAAPLHRAVAASSIQANAIDTAREFLRANRGLLKLENPDAELVVTGRSTDELGRTHVRFDQVHNGLPVWPSELLVHLDAAGNVDLVDGAYVPTPRRLPRVPMVPVAQAVERARGECASAATSVPELIVFAREDRRPRLAWKMTVQESLAKRWVVVVDALSGSMLEKFNAIPTANVTGSGRDLRGTTRSLSVWQEGATFYLLDTTKAMFDPASKAPSPQTTRGGIFIADARNLPATSDPQNFPPDLAVVSSSSSTNWPVADTVSAAFLISQTYDYYLQVHGRNSIDGRKGTIMGIVRLGKGFENAFWDGEQQLMVFGDADMYAGSLDVIAHEMTHGVTDNSSKLVYQGQSGALNEAMSDIFGEMAELRTYGSNDWLMGTHMRTAIRSMSDPKRFGDPSKMSEFLVTKSDNGGVHSNSGIINRAFYLLAEGMPGAIGKSAAEKIFYRANTQHLAKNSQFIDARLAAIASADELFGAGSTQSKKTAEAFDMVEIFAANATPQKPDIPVVQGSDSTLFLYKSSNDLWGLARRETPPDPVQGAALSKFAVAESRPAVTGDGKTAAFVDQIQDICLISTAGGSEEVCAGFPDEGIEVSSVGMSPDGNRFGVVLLGDGEPEDRIIVVDIVSEDSVSIDLSTPVIDADFNLSSVDYADAMTFTQDGRFIVYDALTEVFANGAAWAAWAIYAYDLDEGEFYTIIPPIEGLDIGFPALGKTSDDRMTFEAYDPSTGQAGVYTVDLINGDLKEIAVQSGVESAPSFMGDDRGVIFATGASNATGSRLMRQNLAADKLSPSGSATTWIDQGRFGVIYRRGAYAGPTTVPGSIAFGSTTFAVNEGAVATITVVRSGGVKGQVSVSYSTSGGSASSGTDFVATSGTLTWADGEEGAKSFQVRTIGDTANEGTETATLSLSGAAGGASMGSPSSATLSIANVTSTSSGGKRRSSKH